MKWRELARSVDTIVILMGLQNLREIMRQLLKGGCDPGRPVALIQSGTRPSQRTLVGSAATIADLAEQERFTSPTVIVIGDVVKLRRRLQGYDGIVSEEVLATGADSNDGEGRGLTV